MNRLKRLMHSTIGYNPLAWEKARWAMDRRVAEFLPCIGKPGQRTETGPDCVVVVSPWQGTAVPWFTLAVALMMAERGARIRFVVDDLPYGGNAVRHRHVLSAIRHVMRRVDARFEVKALSEFAPTPVGNDDRAEIIRLARLNATWVLRGEMLEAGREDLVAREIRQNEVAQGHIARVFEDIGSPELLFVPGGVFGHSGLWMREARRRDIRIASFDAGANDVMIVAANGIACQLADIPFAFDDVRRECDTDPATREYALHRAEEELAKRRGGRDRFLSQVKGSGDGGHKLDGGVLIALNSSWDAAALGPHRAFENSTDWLIGTVRYLLDNTDMPVIVRQHPAERLPIAATTEDYKLLLKREFGEHERLHFIAAEDPVNSYALMEQVAAVVVHTSTLGVEAVAFGLPVITGSASYYARLGFVEYAGTEVAFQTALQKAANGQLEVTDAMREDAMLCFYITQCCNWIFSPFNPASFAKWIKQPLAHWSHRESVERMITSLMTGTPIASLNHKAAMERKEAA